MNRAQSKRLDKASSALSPLQLVLKRLQEAHRHESMAAFAATVEEFQPYADTLCGQIETSIRLTKKNAHPDVVRKAQKDGMFLAMLVVQCESHLLEPLETNYLRANLLREQLWRVVLERELDAIDDAEVGRQLHAWRAEAMEHLMRVYADRNAVRWVERTYFGGTPVLFQQTVEITGALIELANALAGGFNMLVEGKHSDLKLDARAVRPVLRPMDKEPTGDPIQIRVRLTAERLVAFAKAHTLNKFGEDRAGFREMRPYVQKLKESTGTT